MAKNKNIKPTAKHVEKKAAEVKTPIKEVEKKVVPDKSQNTDAMRIRAKEVFKSHNDSVKEIYFTSDGTAFIQQQHARMHGESLKDTEVKTIKRTEV